MRAPPRRTQHETASRRPGERAATWSLLVLIALPVVTGVGFVLGMALGFDPDDPGGVGPTLEGTEWLKLVLLGSVVLLPFIVGIYLGARALRRGSRRGLVGLVINTALVLFLGGTTIVSNVVDSLTFKPDEIAAVTVTVGDPVAGKTHLGVIDSRYGEILVDKDGNTLYVDEFQPMEWKGELVGAKEPDDRVWEPALATAAVTVDPKLDPTSVGAILRSDGPRQLTYYGHGLYTFEGDTPGAFKPFAIQNSEEAGGGPRWRDRHVITPTGKLLPTRIPDLGVISEADARAQFEELGLKVVTKEVPAADPSMVGNVQRTDPGAGSVVEAGDTVTLEIGR